MIWLLLYSSNSTCSHFPQPDLSPHCSCPHPIIIVAIILHHFMNIMHIIHTSHMSAIILTSTVNIDVNYSPFYRLKTWWAQRLNNLPKVSQQVISFCQTPQTCAIMLSLCAVQNFAFAFLHLPFPQFGSFFLLIRQEPLKSSPTQTLLWQSWPRTLPSTPCQFLVWEKEGRER